MDSGHGLVPGVRGVRGRRLPRPEGRRRLLHHRPPAHRPSGYAILVVNLKNYLLVCVGHCCCWCCCYWWCSWLLMLFLEYCCCCGCYYRESLSTHQIEPLLELSCRWN